MSIFYYLLIAEAARRGGLQNLTKKNTDKNSSSSRATRSVRTEVITPESLCTNSSRMLYQRCRLDECVLSYLAENQQICEIVDKLSAKAQQEQAADIDKIQKELLALTEESTKVVKNYNKLLREVEQLGIKPESKYTDPECWFTMPDSVEKSGFKYDTIKPPKMFNGVALTKADVLSGKNPYQDRLLEFVGKNDVREEVLTNAKARYDKIASHSIRLRFSEKEREKLDEAEDAYKKAEQAVYVLKAYQKDADTYKNLTEDGKQKLVEFFDAVKQLQDLHKNVYSRRGEILTMKGYYTRKQDYIDYKNALTERATTILTDEEKKALEEFTHSCAHAIAGSSPEELRRRVHFPVPEGVSSINIDIVAYVSDNVLNSLSAELGLTSAPQQKQ